MEHTGAPHFLMNQSPTLSSAFKALANVAEGFLFWVSVLTLMLGTIITSVSSAFPHFGYSKSYPSLEAQGTERSLAVFSHPLFWE